MGAPPTHRAPRQFAAWGRWLAPIAAVLAALAAGTWFVLEAVKVRSLVPVAGNPRVAASTEAKDQVARDRGTWAAGLTVPTGGAGAATDGPLLQLSLLAAAGLGAVGLGGVYRGVRARRRPPTLTVSTPAPATLVVPVDPLSGADRQLERSTRPTPLTRPSARDDGDPSAAAAEGEWAAMFARLPVACLLLAADGRVRRVNRALLDLSGCTEEQALGLKLGDLLGCADCPEAGEPGGGCATPVDGHGCSLWQVILETLRDGAVHRRTEVRRRLTRRGLECDAVLLMSASPIRIGEETMAFVCLEDVTTNRLAEERIREQAALLAEAHDAICVLDAGGRIRFWNRGAEALYGWTAEEAVGEEVTDVLFGGSGAAWRKITDCLEDEGHWDGELEPFHRNHRPLIVDMRASLVREGRGAAGAILLVATDLTETKHLERQLLRAQRLESLGTMACGIAHDLNNVLTPVQMVVDLLRPSVAGTDGERFLDLLTRSARRGSDIIRQLLLFGRGVEGAQVELDLRFLLKETTKILRETFPRSIQVRLDLPDELSPIVGDATQLHQVLMNLCVNARDAMTDGGVLTLTVENVELDERALRAFPGGKPGPYVRLRVEDTGCGIPAEMLERIFDPFFTTKPVGQGTGLGLSTAQGIVRAHHGFVEVATEVGRGTRFTVLFPAGAPSLKPTLAPISVRSEPGQQQLLLVVDDEEEIRELLRTTLERSGYQVVTACDGAEAISVFGRRHGEIAGVLVDMMMPFIDGAAAIAALRKIDPSIPVVAFSGMPGQREVAERAAGGRVIFLGKPFVPGELNDAVQRCLRQGSVDAPPGPSLESGFGVGAGVRNRSIPGSILSATVSRITPAGRFGNPSGPEDPRG